MSKSGQGFIEGSKIIPKEYSIANYPNPFNPSTKIKFDIRKSGRVKLAIYDILGAEVTILVDKYMEAGSYTYAWYARDNYGNQLASGIYIARIKAGNFVKSIKLMLLR
jgi:flagellar hook assembly protein FlgD